MRICCTGPFACTPIVWPTLRSFFFAVDWSITTSFANGHEPSMSVRVLNAGLAGSTLKPRFGAPPKTIDLAVRADQVRLAADAADRVRDVGQVAHLVEQRLVERRRRRVVLVAEVERRLAGDRGVGAAVDLA